MKTYTATLLALLITAFSSSLTTTGQEAAPATEAATPTDSHTQAVEEFFLVMKMEDTSDRTINQMLQMQIQQNPPLAQYKEVMLKFLRKHVSYESLKPEMVALYKEEFTEEEIKTLT